MKQIEIQRHLGFYGMIYYTELNGAQATLQPPTSVLLILAMGLLQPMGSTMGWGPYLIPQTSFI